MTSTRVIGVGVLLMLSLVGCSDNAPSEGEASPSSSSSDTVEDEGLSTLAEAGFIGRAVLSADYGPTLNGSTITSYYYRWIVHTPENPRCEAEVELRIDTEDETWIAYIHPLTEVAIELTPDKLGQLCLEAEPSPPTR